MSRWFNNLRIRNKLLAAFLVVIALTAIVGGVAVVSQNSTQATMNEMLTVDVQMSELALEIDVAVLHARRAEKDYFLRYKELGFEDARSEYVSTVQSNVLTIKGYVDELYGLEVHEEDRARTLALKDAIDEYETTFLVTVDAIEERGHMDEGLEGEFRAKAHEIEDAVEGEHLAQLMIDMLMMRRHEKDYLLRGEEKYVTSLREAVDVFQADVAATSLSAAEKTRLTALSDEYQALFDQLVQLDAQIAADMDAFSAAVHLVEPLTEEIEKDALAQQVVAQDAMEDANRNTTVALIAVSAISAVIGVLIAIGLARRISDTVSVVARAAEGVAVGNLDQRVDVGSGDELGDMAAAFRRMIAYVQAIAAAADRLAQGDLTAEVTPRSEKDVLGNAFSQMIANLNNTISQTNDVVGQVAPSVGQIQAISETLASSAEEQSAAAEEVASSLEETDAQVKSNAESANMANQLVSETSNVAGVGQEKMQAMTRAMGAIATSSQEIERIIKVIDEIAFQTNLLALNAAVEAARAGQHGRGFAVVAQEVRNLAERSARAARETADLIEDSGRRVEEGVDIADETALALGEIVQNVTKVKDLVAEIAAASDDQSRSVEQVSSAMLQVNTGAQSSSQQSEELAATANELAQLAERLRVEASRFKLREERMMAGELAGMTPEMLRQVAELVKAQVAGGGVRAAAGPQAVVEERADGSDRIELPLDRDERGYGEF